ncbi:MAG: hypothetical protein BJ554DRAFT_6053 [Olpidium bornovanus]|uniref:Uncharacterized protein n=1 Tax=Olpidium bornovanus TaxID=278681 RepID=A0A8H8A1W1_9FUNG|nr:MAG: hypothetical protein BJ554DRAFT_6053 [Olpidium bornovanus]
MLNWDSPAALWTNESAKIPDQPNNKKKEKISNIQISLPQVLLNVIFILCTALCDISDGQTFFTPDTGFHPNGLTQHFPTWGFDLVPAL